jgi:hypothetical protein
MNSQEYSIFHRIALPKGQMAKVPEGVLFGLKHAELPDGYGAKEVLAIEISVRTSNVGVPVAVKMIAPAGVRERLITTHVVQATMAHDEARRKAGVSKTPGAIINPSFVVKAEDSALFVAEPEERASRVVARFEPDTSTLLAKMECPASDLDYTPTAHPDGGVVVPATHAVYNAMKITIDKMTRDRDEYARLLEQAAEPVNETSVRISREDYDKMVAVLRDIHGGRVFLGAFLNETALRIVPVAAGRETWDYANFASELVSRAQAVQPAIAPLMSNNPADVRLATLMSTEGHISIEVKFTVRTPRVQAFRLRKR